MKFILKVMLAALVMSVWSFGSKLIVVDLSKQEAYAYENGKLQFSGWISTGKASRPTPRGTFRVLEKDIDHVSSKWPRPNGGAKMHYMLRLTSYGIAMHLGYVPNYPASHGCIRLKNGFAQKMYFWAPVGTKVIVKGHAPRYVVRGNSKKRSRYLAMKKRKEYKALMAAKKAAKRKLLLARQQRTYAISISAKRMKLAKKSRYKKRLAKRAYHSRYKLARVKRGCRSALDILRTGPLKKRCSRAVRIASAKKYRKSIKHHRRSTRRNIRVAYLGKRVVHRNNPLSILRA